MNANTKHHPYSIAKPLLVWRLMITRRAKTTCLFALSATLALAACQQHVSSAAEKGKALASYPAAHRSASPPETLAPALFFSDLDSGSSSGNSDRAAGQNAQGGVFVSVWGARLGEEQGTSQVLFDGRPAKRVLYWGSAHLDNYEKVTFQLDSAAKAGPGKISVIVNSINSNALPFLVRPGNIYYVSSSGRDSNRGNFSSPWRSIVKARDTMRPGDVTYVLDGVNETTEDSEGWSAVLTLRTQWCSETGYPRALVAYPGAHVTIGNTTATRPAAGIRTTDKSGGPCAGNWTFAGLNLRGLAPVAINGPSRHWRFIGNDISCPRSTGSDGGGACFHASMASDLKFLGNVVHDAGSSDASALFHGVYMSTDSNHLDIGWNTIANVRGCRGIQIHSSPLGSDYPGSGTNIYDVQIHDNIIHDTQCDGIVVDTIDPSKGPILIYNNVIYRAGKGPNNPEHTGGWSCINVRGTTEKGTPGSGTIEIYGNTLYACGEFANPPYASANSAIVFSGNKNLRAEITNNIFDQVASPAFPNGVPYLIIWNPTVANGGAVCAPTDECPWVKGSHNLFFGSGAMKANLKYLTGNLYSNPGFANLEKFDFHISNGSPAAGAGVPTRSVTDHDGIPLSEKSGYPIGAYAPDK